MSSTEIAAWWGAIIASFVLLWDVYKWLVEGPRLTLRLSPNMAVWGDSSREGKTWISITVSNIGSRPTTIKGVGMEYYDGWFSRYLNRAERAGVFPNPNDQFPLPRVLNPGDEWIGLVPQDRLDIGLDLEEMSVTGHLMIWLTLSHKQRAMRKRLFISQKKVKPD